MRIRIIEDKSKNYRGNREQQMMCMPYIDAWFVSQAQMTYDSFRKFARRVAEHFGAAELLIVERDETKRLITVCDIYNYETGEWTYKFWYTPEDAKSYKDRIYYKKEDFLKRGSVDENKEE